MVVFDENRVGAKNFSPLQMGEVLIVPAKWIRS
jgi:hypothetical protein